MGKIHVIPSSSGKTKGTIGKSAKNYGEPCRVCFDSWICGGDIKGQRGLWLPLWRMGSGAIWRPWVTWRRVLRTIFMERLGGPVTLHQYYSSSSTYSEAALQVITLRAEASERKQWELCELLTHCQLTILANKYKAKK